MKKQSIISLTVFLSLVSILVGIQAGLESSSKWVVIIIGLGMMIGTIIVFQMGKTNRALYYIACTLNSFATGLVMSAYYIHFEYNPPYESNVLIAIVVFIVVSLLGLIPIKEKIYKKRKLITALLVVFGYTVILTLLLVTKDQFYSQVFFISQIGFFFTIAMIFLKDEEEVLRYCSLSTFGVFIVVLASVLIVLSEGEALEGVGYIGDSKKDNGKK